MLARLEPPFADPDHLAPPHVRWQSTPGCIDRDVSGQCDPAKNHSPEPATGTGIPLVRNLALSRATPATSRPFLSRRLVRGVMASSPVIAAPWQRPMPLSVSYGGSAATSLNYKKVALTPVPSTELEATTVVHCGYSCVPNGCSRGAIAACRAICWKAGASWNCCARDPRPLDVRRRRRARGGARKVAQIYQTNYMAFILEQQRISYNY